MAVKPASMRKISIILLSMPAIAFAAAGFADSYHEHRHWIFPAYSYCLILGLALLLGMFILSLIYRTKTQKITEAVSSYLIRNPILAIIVTDVLLAIPLGIMGSVSWEIYSFMSMFPGAVLMTALPLCLANERIREKYLLSPFAMKWALMISISAIVSSVLFIVLTNWNLLPGTDVTYFARPDRTHPAYHFPAHPYDSMKEIWNTPLLFIAEIPIAIALYWLGLLNRYLYRKLSAARTK